MRMTHKIYLSSLGNFPTIRDVVNEASTCWILRSTQVLIFLSVFTGLGGNVRAEGTCELGPLVFSERVWDTHVVDFWERYREYPFRWTNSSKNVAYFHGKRMPLTSYGKRLAAARFLFKDKRIARTELLAYDEAVDGKIPKEAFVQLFTQIRNSIGVYSGKGNPGMKVLETGTRRELWVNDTTAFFLEFRYQSVSPQYATQFRGDFIRLTTAPRAEAAALRTAAKPQIARMKTLKENVTWAGSAVYIDSIPMCLEGSSSSSDAASTEMLFNYLKMPIDQREVAATMSAESSIEGPFHALRTSLDKLAPPTMFKRAVLREFDRQGWQNLVDDYNWNARTAGHPMIDTKLSLEPDAALRKMDSDSLRRAIERAAPVETFHTVVVDQVQRGIPILWGVQLGIVPERNIPLSYCDSREEDILQTSKPGRFVPATPRPTDPTAPKAWIGKHMRLIVGYDDHTREVIYTDPWGDGHARKRMAVSDANTITLSLYVVHPKF